MTIKRFQIKMSFLYKQFLYCFFKINQNRGEICGTLQDLI